MLLFLEAFFEAWHIIFKRKPCTIVTIGKNCTWNTRHPLRLITLSGTSMAGRGKAFVGSFENLTFVDI